MRNWEITRKRVRPGPVCCTILTLCLLTACASPPPGQRTSYVSAIGTPFYLAFKVPVCAATLAVAGPAAALQGLAAPSENELQPDIRPMLDEGISDNCGPPYVLPPE